MGRLRLACRPPVWPEPKHRGGAYPRCSQLAGMGTAKDNALPSGLAQGPSSTDQDEPHPSSFDRRKCPLRVDLM